MSVKLVVDMNLSVEWVAELTSHGWSAVHWSTVLPSLSADSGLTPLFLARMLFFVLTSVIAFAYAWRKGVFRYD